MKVYDLIQELMQCQAGATVTFRGEIPDGPTFLADIDSIRACDEIVYVELEVDSWSVPPKEKRGLAPKVWEE